MAGRALLATTVFRTRGLFKRDFHSESVKRVNLEKTILLSSALINAAELIECRLKILSYFAVITSGSGFQFNCV
jgi:hypothetical protein